MTFAHFVGPVADTESVRLPPIARRLDTGQWVRFGSSVPASVHEACGWFAVVDVARPAGTETTTHDRSVELIDGVASVVWTPRPWNVDEIAARNAAVIRDQATQALAVNRTFLALSAPTNAQTLAQVKAMARQLNGLIRLAVGALDGTD